MSWRQQAACLGKPLEWWFPRSGNADAYRRGQEVCAGCPVAAECRAERIRAERELRLPISGLWGGEIHGRGRRMLSRMGATVECACCGGEFTDRGTGPTPRFCSGPCSQRAGYRRRRGLPEADPSFESRPCSSPERATTLAGETSAPGVASTTRELPEPGKGSEMANRTRLKMTSGSR